MKSEHRHELKTNELAQWLANFPQWVKENLKTIIYVAIVIAVALSFHIYRKYQKNIVAVQEFVLHTNIVSGIIPAKAQIIQSQAQGVDTSYVLLELEKQLNMSVEDARTDEMAALALIKQGQMLRTELHYRLENISKANLTDQINRAKDYYIRAAARLSKVPASESSSQNPALLAVAQFGIGLCEEELGNFEQAKKAYQDISTKPEFEGTTAAASAKQRLVIMADYQKKIVFKSVPRPIVPAEQPQPEKAYAPLFNDANSQQQNATAPASDTNLPGK